MRKSILTLVLGAAVASIVASESFAQQITSQTWPKGTLLSRIEDGGRISTYHRGYLYLGGLGRTTVYDIADPTNPRLVNEWNVGANGHRWWKMGDMFWREYSQPEIADSEYRFVDLSGLPNVTPWTGEAPLPIRKNEFQCCSDLVFFPYMYMPWQNDAIMDQRTGEIVSNFDFNAQRAVNGQMTLRIGELLFYLTETPNSGMSVFDVGDPQNIRLRDVLQGDYFQYTTFYAVWRNYIVLMVGDDSNAGGNNMIAIDYSDPDNLTFEWGLPTSEVTSGRYIFFQDEYGFVSDHVGDSIAKINMEQRTVEQLPLNLSGRLLSDFQAIPLGHLLLVSSSEANNSDFSYLFTHQDQADTKKPYVGYHRPADGATNQPVTTTIGLVINETLDDTTVNGANIEVRELVDGMPSGDPLPVDVISSQHDVVNVTPRSPLKADTTYEVKVVADGIRDVAGNGIEESVFHFSTGSAIASDLTPDITSVDMNVSQPVEGQAVSFSASATHPDGVVEYRWQFGDGTETNWSSSNSSISQTFVEPGQYSVLLQARAQTSSGEWYVAAESMNIVVTSEFSPPSRDMRSSPIVIDQGARTAWSVNPDNDSVAVIDVDQAQLIREIGVCDQPSAVALDQQGRAWVACKGSDDINVVSSDGSVVSEIALARGAQPRGIVMSEDGSRAFVAAYGLGEVVRLDTSDFSTTGSVSVGPRPQGMALSQDGTLLVTRFISGEGEGQVYVVATAGDMALQSTVSLPLDTSSVDNGAAARGLPNYVRSVAYAPGGEQAWYVGKKDNILRGLTRDGKPLTHESTVRALVGRVDAFSMDEEVEARVDIDDASVPSAVAVSPLGAHVFVTLQGNNRLAALDRRTGEEVATADVDLAPQGVAVDPVSHRVFVHNFLGRSVTVLDGASLIENGETEMPVVATIESVGSEALPAEVLRGKEVFYDSSDPRMALEGYMTCATCHDSGGHDGRVWDFSDDGEGLRRTVSLRGTGGMDHGPLHWSGNFDEVQDFEISIRKLFGGEGFLSDSEYSSDPLGPSNAGHSSDLDALAAYVASLDDAGTSPHRNADGSLTAAAQRGRQVFSDHNCSDCHGGEGFTDSALGRLHDVGTLESTSGSRLGGSLTGLDTPSLLGLWNNSRFLHDGSAATLMEVFSDPSASQHGEMDDLNDGERADLEAYLLQIDETESVPDVRPAPPENLSAR